MTMSALSHLIDKHEKLAGLVFGVVALFGGLWVTASDAKYEAYSYAVAGMAAALMAGVAWQKKGAPPIPTLLPTDDDEPLPSRGAAKP